ncbi:MAG: FtsW/RodA/SpoVE family cell cycle protein [Eubacterium sp.]|nr:FtsW/RodA/SpoVE family cell cycle protein [Eubacterium sp.]
MDYAILFLVFFLVAFGLVMIYSTSSYKGGLYYNDAGYWLKRQALFAGLGAVAMVLIANWDYHFWNSRDIFFYIYYGGTALLLLFTLVFAAVSHGSKRWISVGPVRFQPSEAAKVTLILILAIYISDHVRQMQDTRGIMRAFLLVLPVIGLVGIENLSTCIILLAITVTMIFVSSSRYLPFVALGAVAVVGLGGLLLMASYRLERIKTWLHPETSEKGMQTMQGLYAIGSGGLFGKGLGQSMQKMGFLPETHNDMIFSIICEELGLFGAICVIILYFVLLWRFLRVAMKASDLFGSMIVIGAIAHIGFQVFVNIGVVTNTIPNTGVPLPFISYGGTSMLFLLVEMGLVLSVSRYTR